jgi:hypothetical protein
MVACWAELPGRCQSSAREVLRALGGELAGQQAGGLADLGEVAVRVSHPPGFMMIHELDSLTMHGFSSRTTVPPGTREYKSRDRATSRTVTNSVTRKPSAGAGRLAMSVRPGTPAGGLASWWS